MELYNCLLIVLIQAYGLASVHSLDLKVSVCFVSGFSLVLYCMKRYGISLTDGRKYK